MCCGLPCVVCAWDNCPKHTVPGSLTLKSQQVVVKLQQSGYAGCEALIIHVSVPLVAYQELSSMPFSTCSVACSKLTKVGRPNSPNSKMARPLRTLWRMNLGFVKGETFSCQCAKDATCIQIWLSLNANPSMAQAQLRRYRASAPNN